MEDVLESAVETFRDRASRSEIETVRQYDAGERLDGNPEQLRRVVINLVTNAIDTLEQGGTEKSEIWVAMGGTEFVVTLRR